MKGLTICQPYAELIARGDKFVENRTWDHPHRGPLAVHAGKSRCWLREADVAAYPDMAFGAIVAVCTLDNCLHIDALREQAATDQRLWRATQHVHTEGPYCFLLTDIVRLRDPVPARGYLGLWGLDTALATDLLNEWRDRH